MLKKKLKITGMHCSSCAVMIDMDLEDVSGVQSVRTSYAKSETEVEFDETEVESDTLIETVKKTGYKASLVD